MYCGCLCVYIHNNKPKQIFILDRYFKSYLFAGKKKLVLVDCVYAIKIAISVVYW